LDRRFIAFLLFSSVISLIGCPDDKCANPKRGVVDGREGPLVKCNVIITCPQNGGRPDRVTRLGAVEDPAIVDTGRPDWNVNRCKEQIIRRGACSGAIIEPSPEALCLDADSGLDGAGPIVTGPAGGVAVGVGSGDYYFQEATDDGAGGFRADSDTDEEEAGDSNEPDPERSDQ